MELTQLRYFLEVANSLHITASAKKLHIAQPALSQSIRRLEKELGVPLIAAKGRNIILTPYGSYLKEELEPILNRLDHIPLQLERMAGINQSTIRLNVLAATSLITNAIIEYKDAHPDVNFVMLQNTQSELADIEISSRIPPEDSGKKPSSYPLVKTPTDEDFIFTERIFLAVPSEGKFENHSNITLQEVAKEGFISLLGSRQFRTICDTYCAKAGIQPKIIFESDNPAAVRNMIAANIGIGFWPEFSWGSSATDQVKVLEITNPVCRRDLCFKKQKGITKASVVNDFYEFLISYCLGLAK